MGRGLRSWEMSSPVPEFDIEDQAHDYPATVGTHPHTDIIESVLESADKMAEAIEPGARFELPIDDLATSTPDIDLGIELAMRAGDHDLLVVKVGATAILLQVCSPSNSSGFAAD